MKKKNKWGINTGNKIAFGNDASYMKRQKGSQHVIIKSMKNKFRQPADWQELNKRALNAATQLVDDGEINANITYSFSQGTWWGGTSDIVYTMNKRKRWEMKNRVLESIQELRENNDKSSQSANDKKCTGEAQFDMTLVERGIMAQAHHYGYRGLSDCTAYHSNKTKKEHAYPSDKYSFETDLEKKSQCKVEVNKREENKKQRKIGHNQHFRDIQRKHVNFKDKRKQKIQANLNNHDDDDWAIRAHPTDANRQEEDVSSIPEIHYEICGPRPLSAHKKFFDYKYKFEYWGSFSHRPFNKALKKCKYSYNKAAYVYTGYGKKELNDFRQLNSNQVNYNVPVGGALYGNVEDANAYYADYGDLELDNDADFDDFEKEEYKVQESFIDFSKAFEKQIYDKNNNAVKGPTSEKPKKKRAGAVITKCAVPNMASSNNVKKYGKGEFIYDNVTSPGQLQEENHALVNETSNQHVNSIERNMDNVEKEAETAAPTCIQIESNSLHPKELLSQYEDSYIEGSSNPRTFIINISHYYFHKHKLKNLDHSVKDTALSTNLIPEGGIHGTGNVLYAIFKFGSPPTDTKCVQVKDCEEEEFHLVTQCESVGVNIEGNFGPDEKIGIQQRLIRNLPGNTILTVKEVTDIIVETQVQKYHHLFQAERVPTGHRRKDQQLYKHISSHSRWNLEFYLPKEAHHMVKDSPLHNGRNKLMQVKKLGSISIVENKDTDNICDICLTTTNADIYNIVNGTSLLSCHHWFCNECWREHLCEGIRNGVLSLECPAYECNTIMDDVSVMSLLGYKTYENHWLQVQNAKLETRPEWKWCPRTVCNKTALVQVFNSDPSDHFVCVHCVCGHMWCFDCQNDAHWPIPCEVADTYGKIILQRDPYVSANNSEKIMYVEVKKCKQCRQPIEKSGGCQHMYCKCGFSFCWECLQSWESHGSSLTCPTGQVNLSAVHLDDHVGVLTKEQFFDKALVFRKKRELLLQNEKNIGARLFKIVQNCEKIHAKNRKQLLQNMYARMNGNSPEYARNVKALKDMYCYLYQLYHFLEFVFAFFSQVKMKRSQKMLVNNLDILCLVTAKIEQVIQVKRMVTVSDLVQQYEALHQSSFQTMKKISRKLAKVNIKPA